MLKLFGLAALFFSLSLQASSAGNELKHIFSKMGFSTNISNVSTYQTQAAGYVAFGSAYARDEVRNIQVMHVDTPLFRSGCGGIDIFAGGFSFITSDELVKFMKNILSNGGGYALNLALETELPEMARSMQYMQDIATKINNFNMGSCENAESLVQGLWPRRRLAHQKICEDIGMNNSKFSDWAAAKNGCSTGSSFDELIEAGQKDPKYKDRIFINKNVVWDVITSNKFLNDDKKLAEVYLSISGTVVFDKNSATRSYPSLATNRNFIKAILYGGKLPAYQCKDSDSDKCLNVDYSDESYQEISENESLVFQVQEHLEDMYNHILTDTPLSDVEQGLIAVSNTEVFSLVSSNAQLGVGVQSAHVLAETIACEILSQYLANALGIIRNSLAGKEIEPETQKQLYSNIARVQGFVSEFENGARAQFNQAIQTNQLIGANVKTAMSQLGASQ